MPRARAGAAESHGRGVPRAALAPEKGKRGKEGEDCACRRAGLWGEGNAEHLTALLLLSPITKASGVILKVENSLSKKRKRER